MFCSRCGSANLDDAIICKTCGSGLANSGNATAPPSSVRRDNIFGKLCKWGIALWSLFCLFGAISGIVNVANKNQGAVAAGAIGVTIGLGLWFFVWFLPTVGGAVLYLLFGREWGAPSNTAATPHPKWSRFLVLSSVLIVLLALFWRSLNPANEPGGMDGPAETVAVKNHARQPGDVGAPAKAAAREKSPAATSLSNPTTPTGANHWQASEERSKMDGSLTVALALNSPDTVQGWLESMRPTLIVRCLEHKTSVYVVTGTAAQPVEGANEQYPVDLRFDEGKPTTQWWSESTDSKALGVWESESAIALGRRLAKAKKLVFRFTPINASPVIASFDLSGLDHLLPKVALACDWASADESRAKAKAASAALRARLAQYVHQCADQTVGKWCWSDPDDVLFNNDFGFENSREKALEDAVEYAREGLTFKKK